MKNINIIDGTKSKCPNCNSVFAISSGDELLLRNVSLIYINKKRNVTELKCKQCKGVIVLDSLI